MNINRFIKTTLTKLKEEDVINVINRVDISNDVRSVDNIITLFVVLAIIIIKKFLAQLLDQEPNLFNLIIMILKLKENTMNIFNSK